jgi:hypothetical protein
VRGRRFSVLAASGAAAISLALSACGGTTEPQASGPPRNFPVRVSSSFPVFQRLAQKSLLLVRVKNVGSAAIPNVAVTLTNPKYGSSAQALGTLIPPTQQGQPILATRSRPIWIINKAPGPCGYSCRHLGPGAGATAYSNTWALGPLRPGQSIVFDWLVTAVQAGNYAVRYQVAGDLDGGARAVDRTGNPASGTLKVRISGQPRHAWVKQNGQVVYTR